MGSVQSKQFQCLRPLGMWAPVFLAPCKSSQHMAFNIKFSPQLNITLHVNAKKKKILVASSCGPGTRLVDAGMMIVLLCLKKGQIKRGGFWDIYWLAYF